MQLPWHLYLMASLYILAGLNHFRVPRIYTRMIPPYFPAPKALNSISGLAEIVLGILLCIPQTSAYAAWGIIALLIAIFPANVYMLQDKKAAWASRNGYSFSASRCNWCSSGGRGFTLDL